MYSTTINSNRQIQVEKNNENWKVDNSLIIPDILKVSEGNFHVILENISYSAEIVNIDYKQKHIEIKINNNTYTVSVKDKLDQLLENLGMANNANTQLSHLKAPMPGLILDIPISAGDEVKKGTPLIILEAMKMENIIKSPGDGKITSIEVKKGDSVEKNQVLIQF